MTVADDIFLTLKTLVASRVFEEFAPFGTACPYIVYSQVGGDALSFLEGTLPDKKNGRMQIDVYAKTRQERSSIALQVESAMSAAPAFQSRAMGAAINNYEPDTLIYSSMQDFSVFSTR